MNYVPNEINNPTATSDVLVELMETKGVSVHGLANETGLSLATIRRLRRQNMVGSVYTWSLIAEALGVSLSELIGR